MQLQALRSQIWKAIETMYFQLHSLQMDLALFRAPMTQLSSSGMLSQVLHSLFFQRIQVSCSLWFSLWMEVALYQLHQMEPFYMMQSWYLAVNITQLDNLMIASRILPSSVCMVGL